jgi:hypothetical protein
VKQHLKPVHAVALSQKILASGGLDNFIAVTDLAYGSNDRKITQN